MYTSQVLFSFEDGVYVMQGKKCFKFPDDKRAC